MGVRKVNQRRRATARRTIRRKRSRLGRTGTCAPVAKENPNYFAELTPEPLNEVERDLVNEAIALLDKEPDLTPEQAVIQVVCDADLRVVLSKLVRRALQQRKAHA